MGATKTLEFTVKDNKLAKYTKALAHPARISILQLLAKKQTCICGDIVDELPLSNWFHHNLNNSARESQTIPEVLLSIIPNFLMNLILSTDRIWSSATCPWRF